MHVVVVGGGIAGLSAGARLRERFESGDDTATVTLLEASDRLGGRVRGEQWRLFLSSGERVVVPLELGAELVHGSASILKLAEEEGWDMDEIVSLSLSRDSAFSPCQKQPYFSS